MKITSVDVNLYRVPADRPRVGSIQAFEAMGIALVDIHTDEGITDTGFTYTIGTCGHSLSMAG